MSNANSSKSADTLTFTSIAREADKRGAEKIAALIKSSLEVSFTSIARK